MEGLLSEVYRAQALPAINWCQPKAVCHHIQYRVRAAAVSVKQLSNLSLSPSLSPPLSRVSKSLDHPRDKDGNNPILHCIELQHHVDELKSIVSTLPSRPQELVSNSLTC